MVSEDDVAKIALLARLEIERDFIPIVTGHLNSILGYVARLNEINTTGIVAMSHVHGSINVMREDICFPVGSNPEPEVLGSTVIPAQEMLDSAALTQNVPEHSGPFIKVPLIVE